MCKIKLAPQEVSKKRHLHLAWLDLQVKLHILNMRGLITLKSIQDELSKMKLQSPTAEFQVDLYGAFQFYGDQPMIIPRSIPASLFWQVFHSGNFQKMKVSSQFAAMVQEPFTKIYYQC